MRLLQAGWAQEEAAGSRHRKQPVRAPPPPRWSWVEGTEGMFRGPP